MSNERGGPFGRGEEFLKFFNKGLELTKELISENEKLRRRLVQVETQTTTAARNPNDWEKLRQELTNRIETLELERDNALERLREIESENHHFAERYVEVEEENNALANLYVASFQLHSTLDLSEVLKIVLEIVINLIGAEVFAIYVLDEKANRLEAVASEGAPIAAFPRVPRGSGVIGSCVQSGDTFCGDASGSDDYQTPIACIPLRVQDQALGAIAIYRLLQQKERFTPLDHELFTLLAGHAATAIFSSRLFGQSERKLSTIQGFIDLLTK
jgi:GAF domain-containing protein